MYYLSPHPAAVRKSPNLAPILPCSYTLRICSLMVGGPATFPCYDITPHAWSQVLHHAHAGDGFCHAAKVRFAAQLTSTARPQLSEPQPQLCSTTFQGLQLITPCT